MILIIYSKINTKKFIDWIKTNQVSKVVRCLDKGLDPNFHISDDGNYKLFFSNPLLIKCFNFVETPLSCACVDLLEPRSMIMALVNGGAHLDFRVRQGALTPLHKSAIHCRKEAIMVSLTDIFNFNYDQSLLDFIGTWCIAKCVR